MDSRANNPDPAQIDIALAEGLRSLKSPTPGPDFDARVLAAIDSPRRWRGFWLSVRPALSAGICSLAATVVLVQWSSGRGDLTAVTTHSATAIVRPDTAARIADFDTLVTDAGRSRARLSAAFRITIAAPAAALRKHNLSPLSPIGPIGNARQPNTSWLAIC